MEAGAALPTTHRFGEPSARTSPYSSQGCSRLFFDCYAHCSFGPHVALHAARPWILPKGVQCLEAIGRSAVGDHARAFRCICIVLYKRMLRCGSRAAGEASRGTKLTGKYRAPARSHAKSSAATHHCRRPCVSLAPRSRNQQRSASGCSAPVPTGGRIRPHKITAPQRLAPKSPASR
jgi:hypothetical protein